MHHSIARTAWILVAFFLMSLAAPDSGHALTYARTASDGTESLVLTFSSSAPKISVARTGTQEVRVTFPTGFWKKDGRPVAKSFPSGIITKVAPTSQGLTLTLGTNAFGYFKLPAKGNAQTLQFFKDAIGAKWKPAGVPKASKKAPKTVAKKKPAPRPKAKPKPKAKPAPNATKPQKSGQQVAQKAEQAAPETDDAESYEDEPDGELLEMSDLDSAYSDTKPANTTPRPAPQLPQVSQATQKEQPASGGKPYFSVPNSLRAPIQTGGPDGAEQFGQIEQTAAPASVADADQSPDEVPEFQAPLDPLPELNTSDSTPEVEVLPEQQTASASVGPSAAATPVAAQTAASDGTGLRMSISPPGTGPEEATTVQDSIPQAASDAAELSQPLETDEPAQNDLLAENDVNTMSEDIPSAPAAPVKQVDLSTEQSETRMAVVHKTLDQIMDESKEAADELEEDLEEMEPEAADEMENIEDSFATDADDIAADIAEAAEESVYDTEVNATDDTMYDEMAGLAENATNATNWADQLSMAHTLMNQGDLVQAEDILKNMSFSEEPAPELREEAMYDLARLYYQSASDEDNFVGNYEKISGSYNRAMNYNSNSTRIPTGLLHLGILNLKVGNLPEARAYFNLLKKEYPDDENIPYIYYYWGKHYADKQDYQNAADNYQYLVQVYPDSRVVREAALGLAEALEKLGYYEQTYQIVDYIDKRWPRYYVESPEFLKFSGNVANTLKKYEEAKSDYWSYYNIEPEAEGIDVILARIGDIYLRKGHKLAARDVYQEVALKYPDKEGGLVAKMRLAEEGVYDNPSLEQMDKVFDRPYNVRPVEIYTQIAKKYPNSALAPLAQLKLAMWYFWNKNYVDSLKAVDVFMSKYPKNSLAERAIDVGVKAFTDNVQRQVDEKNWARIVDMWASHPFLHDNQDKLPMDIRLDIALGYGKIGKMKKALTMAEPFLGEKKEGALSDKALAMAQDIYRDAKDWQALVNLAKKVNSWQLTPMQRQSLDYDRAKALVNMGDEAASEGLWAKLAEDFGLPPTKRADAMFHMARFARDNKKVQEEFLYAQEALTLAIQNNMSEERIRELLTMLIDVTDRAKRLNEALRFALDYDRILKLDDPEWAAARFRLAGLYKKLTDLSTWQAVLEDLAAKKPDSLYGAMAKSELEAFKLEQEAAQYYEPASFPEQ